LFKFYSWANLELQTFDTTSEEDQSYKAGFLEGYITGELIEMSYETLGQEFCINNTFFCQSFRTFVEENTVFIKSQIKKYSETDDYWHQIHLVYKQLEGMQKGYKLWKEKNNRIPVKNEFLSETLFLNLAAEFEDFEQFLSPETARYEGHCSALIKPLPDGSDLFVAHTTWVSYDQMLRVMKKYNFAFKTIDQKLIPGHSVAFPSYPGVINSVDDYYILSSSLVVQETTLENRNKSLWENINSKAVVLEFVRNIIANRLANSGKEWTDIFGLYNSGTYNNQFMIIDYKNYKTGTKLSDLKKNLLWVLEQMPGLIRAADVTDVLTKQGYWASYNRPYFEEIYKISGNEDKVKKHGPYYSFKDAPRAQIFRRDHSKVTDLKSMYKLMRYNDFKNDPLSQCSVYKKTCSLPYSPHLAIASRGDLNEPNGKYSSRLWSNSGFGATDSKITNSEMVMNLEMLAVSGPTDEQQPPFKWSTSNLVGHKHFGQPDLFNFKPVYIKWFPYSYVNATHIK
jgi:hypothetical protein